MKIKTKNNLRILISVFIIASFMFSFNTQVFDSPANNNTDAKTANSSILSSTQSASTPVLHKMSNQQKMQPINIYTNLVRESSIKNLTVTNLSTNRAIILSNKPSNLIFDNFKQYLLNFTFQDTYFTESSQNNKGVVNSELHPNVTITSFAFFPLLLNVYSNSSIESGSWTTVVTQVDTSAYNASIGFDVNFGLQYKFWANVFGVEPTAGPASFVSNFHKQWNFVTPFDGKYLGNRLSFTIPTTIPFLSSVGIGVQPKIDADLSSLVQAKAPDLTLTKSNLLWQNSHSIQSFSFYTPFSHSQTTAPVDMFNFNMDFTLSLEFSLEIGIGIPFLSSFPININIFSLPLAKASLPISGNILTNPTVTPSSKVPDVEGVNYDYASPNNNVIHPGDRVNVTFSIINLGAGPASNISITGTSNNVTFSGSGFVSLLNENQQDSSVITGFYFTVPSNYPSEYLFTTAVFSYTSPNGNQYTSSYDMYFRVVLTGESYLQVSNVYYNTPGGSTWNAGDNLDLTFNVTNIGANTLTLANISNYQAVDTDTANPVSYTSSATNTSNSIAVGKSAALGTISLSSPSNHKDGLVYFYFLVYYEDGTYGWYDYYYLTIPIAASKPDYSLNSVIGTDLTQNNGKFMAGDTVNLQFSIKNIGTGAGSSITAQLFSYSSDLNFTNSFLKFSNLNSGSSGSATGQVIISPSARNQTAIFAIRISSYDSVGDFVTQTLNVSIDIVEQPSPKIQLINYLMYDVASNKYITSAVPGDTLIIYVNLTITNQGVGVIGNISTTSDLNVMNASSYYGNLDNQYSYGSGFVVYVPLNYDGSQARINVTVTAQSLSGRVVNKSSYILLTIPKGDVTAPNISANGSFPTTVNESGTASVSVTATDPTVQNEPHSGMGKVYIAYSFNNETFEYKEMTASAGTYSYSFDTAKAGTYRYIIIGLDKAGNYAYISNGNNFFTISVNALATPSSSTGVKSSSGFEFITLLASFSAVVLIYNIQKRRK